jgi:hypothetical protein
MASSTARTARNAIRVTKSLELRGRMIVLIAE